MKKIIKYIATFLIAFVVIAQFFRPERFTTEETSNNDITIKMQVPENVMSIFKRSCFDCHSNNTTWPWYSNIAPMSWLVSKHVRDGRTKMNFSEWGKLSASKQEKRLVDICDEISENEMPLKSYLLLHSDAKLSQQDKEVICTWIKSLGIENEEENDGIK